MLKNADLEAENKRLKKYIDEIIPYISSNTPACLLSARNIFHTPRSRIPDSARTVPLSARSESVRGNKLNGPVVIRVGDCGSKTSKHRSRRVVHVSDNGQDGIVVVKSVLDENREDEDRRDNDIDSSDCEGPAKQQESSTEQDASSSDGLLTPKPAPAPATNNKAP
jgi:hypothetical protein